MISRSGLLLTDLYQLTMLQGYWHSDMNETAVFEFFVRNLPPCRNYLVAAGLDQVLEFLEEAQFTEEELSWLEGSGHFSPRFIESLENFHFSGDVRAMPEGTLFFPHEPILQIIAPISEAQLVETRIINLLQFQSLVASKAARCVTVAPDKLLVDFGLRRAHGAEAGLLAARAAYLAGFAGTSTVVAGSHFGIPLYGTMAHSFVEAHDEELLAFAHFATAQPDNVILLVDTYDTEEAARNLPELANELREQGVSIKGVRLDSGDLAMHAEKVRAILDAGDLKDASIFASGGLDEHAIQGVIRAGAPIDGFGIGSKLDTSADAPYLDCAYKLVEYSGRPRRKLSEKKATWPGPKQVYRRLDDDGIMLGDTVACADEDCAGDSLLVPVMRDGRRLASEDALPEARDRMRRELERLPPALKALHEKPGYPIAISDGLLRLAEETDRWLRAQLHYR